MFVSSDILRWKLTATLKLGGFRVGTGGVLVGVSELHLVFYWLILFVELREVAGV